MKLKEAFYCPECQEVFNYAEYQTVCPSCANRYTFSLQRTWFSQPKEVQNENIKINRVYVTPARYPVCCAGAGKDDYPDYQKSQSDVDKASSTGDKLGRNRSLYRLGIKTIRNIAKFLDCVDVHRKHRKQKSNIEHGIQRFDANTMANILHRR